MNMKAKAFELQPSIWSPIMVIAFLNFILLIVLLLVFYSFFASPSGYEIRMPSMAKQSLEAGNILTVRINAENVLFLNDKVVTLNDLKRGLLKSSSANRTIYVQVDSRASMARVADVWEMCKGLGVAQVKVSTF